MDEDQRDGFPFIRDISKKKLGADFAFKQHEIQDILRNTYADEARTEFSNKFVSFHNAAVDVREALAELTALSNGMKLDSVPMLEAKTKPVFCKFFKIMKQEYIGKLEALCQERLKDKFEPRLLKVDEERIETMFQFRALSQRLRFQYQGDKQTLINKKLCKTKTSDLNVSATVGNKRSRIVTKIQTKEMPVKRSRTDYGGEVMLRAVHKPQLSFMNSISNDDAPFVPKLRMKHHAGKKHISDSEHPYFAELKDIEVDKKLLKEQSVLVIDPCEQVELTFIDTVKGLEELIVFLNKQEEFAVDLEHHDLRSFLGITCLIQISTAFKDFIIDPFPIWNEMWQLNEPFTDPAILKVFHGAHSDIIWLQRDFGIYVVNMIDTQAVMKACNITPLGLSSLIRRYYNIELDKKYQRADWRYRPLTKEMLTYARCDTHYLLGAKNLVVNDCLKMGNDFQNLVRQAFDESTVICMSHFEQPRFVLEIVGKHKAKYTRFSLLQRLALKRLFKWRDAVAREEDESLNYVIKDDALFSIAEVMPEDVQGLLNTCIPTPPLLTKHANELSSLLYKMREYSEDMCAKLLEEEEVHVAEEVKANGPTTHSRNEDDLRVQAMFDKMDCTSEYVNTSVPKTVCSDERFGEFPKIEINAGSDVLKLVKLTAEIQKEGKSVIKKAPFHLKNRLRKVIPISVVPAVKQVFEEQSELATPFEQHLLALMELERNQPDANTMRDLRIKEAQVKCKKGWAEM